MASKCAKRLKMTEEKLENKRNGTLLALPDEVLLKILSYLSTYDILKRVAPVCRNFERLSKDPLLINELYFFDRFKQCLLPCRTSHICKFKPIWNRSWR